MDGKIFNFMPMGINPNSMIINAKKSEDGKGTQTIRIFLLI
jgi:hypothetical protein